ncbi:MAG TPA: thioredoxin domain-containing protein [Parachlamydiaceae bacterium]|nr:thioredoxin domain-containing protein [Parachlamydiaceae bacterium]
MEKRASDWLFGLATGAIITGFLFSLISYLQVCKETCGKAHDYTLFGMNFAYYGLIFFPVLGLLHAAFWDLPKRLFTALLIAAGLGAELDFMLVQKYQLQSFCPICLLIATSLFLTAVAYVAAYTLGFEKLNQRTEIMKSIKRGVSTLSFLVLGFLFAFIGIAKEDPLEAAENGIKDKIILGNLKSQTQVYFFTDWQCPACRSIEPAIEKLMPKIAEKAQVIFVDTVVHKDTLNFIPYNLSFLLYQKSKYMQLRKALTALSAKTSTPQEEEVKGLIAPLGANYKQLNYSDVSGAVSYFDDLVREFNIEFTPTMVIIHKKQKPGIKLQGSEISEENILNAIR